MTAGLEIAPCSAADLPLVQALAHRIWPHAYGQILSAAQIGYMLERMYSLAALQEQFTVKGHRFVLAEREGEPIGFASFEHGLAGDRTRLHKLYVLPEVKGSGVGHALLQAVLRAAGTVGDSSVELNVNKHNPAKHFYLHHGFTVERDEVIDIGQGFVMDDHVMVLDLRSPAP